MNILNQLYLCFEKFNPLLGCEVKSVSKNDFTFSIELSNCQLIATTEKNVISYFGNVPCKVRQVPNTHNAEILVSRVEIPKDAYSILEVIKHIEKAERKKGLFLGVSSFGDYYMNFDSFTHGYLTGASGYGKSVFFKNLLAQTLAFHEDVSNFIVDPKKVDFKFAKDHPRVLGVYTEAKEWGSLIKTLLTELKFRMSLFNSSFEMPPNNLKEYRSYSQSSEDLPSLQRIIVWIDEAHELFKGEQLAELGDALTYIARTGRAFGIHLFMSSQRVGDISSIVKGQCSNNFNFFQPEYSAYYDHSNVNMAAIPGRLYYKNRETKEDIEIQTPFCTTKDCIAVSYHWLNKAEKPPQAIFPLEINRKLIEHQDYSVALRSGASFENLSESFKSYSRNELMKGYCLNFYKFQVEEQAPVKKANKDTLKKPDMKDSTTNKGSKSKLLSDKEMEELANSLFGEGNFSEKKETKPEESFALEMPSFKKVKNSVNIQQLLAEFQSKYEEARADLKWLQVDLSSNAGLLSLNQNRELFLQDEIKDLIIGVEKMAINDIGKSRVESFCLDTKAAIKNNTKAPCLIVEGESGAGKRTLIKNIAFDLGLEVHFAQEIDLFQVLREKEDNFLDKDVQRKKDKEIHNQEHKIIIFDNLVSAVEFYRKAPANIVVACSYQKEKGFFAKPSLDLRYLDVAYTHILLDEDMYTVKKVGDLLLGSLLESLNYSGKSISIDSFIKRGVSPLPASLYKVLKRAKEISTLRGDSFDHFSVQAALEDFDFAKTEESAFVSKIIPVKTRNQIILNEKNSEDLDEVIHRIKSIGSTKKEYEQKLRNGDRLVALFGGLPGTGKTFSAEVIAKETGRELWVCDFASLQSAYVGETEKHIKKLFDQAKSANAVLLLDECDSILKSRDLSQADYAKNWTNQFLRQMDEFGGVLILTTNYMGSLDTAISRRIDIKAEFELPDEDAMIKIIEEFFKPDAPVAKDLDIAEAVKGLRLSGGLIRNALEKLIFQLKRENKNLISTADLKYCLQEIASDEELINPKKRRIGIAG